MRMRNLLNKNNNRLKKSQTLFVGSFLIFMGILSLSWNYLLRMKDEVYSDMRIAMMDDLPNDKIPDVSKEQILPDVDLPENMDADAGGTSYVIDYSKYLGVLEIPKIGLKRGFYNTDSRYNNIQYNVTLVEGSTLPDVDRGNLILMAHSGDAYISYFAYLYRLQIGDMAYVTYAGNKYTYQIVNIYEVEKNGMVVIHRNSDKTSLTMITCTKGNDFTQTVYIAELVS